MAPRKPTKKKPVLHPTLLRSLSLSSDVDMILQRLASDASDMLGWKVSSSAIMRALLRYAEQQDAAWVQDSLFPLIEEELTGGVLWGRRAR